MKIYFENFGRGAIWGDLTPAKPYEVFGFTRTGAMCIFDDVGFKMFVRLNTTNFLTKSEWKVVDGIGKYLTTPVTDDENGHYKAWEEIVLIAKSLGIPVKYTNGPQNSVVHVGDITLSGATASVLSAAQAVLIRSVKC